MIVLFDILITAATLVILTIASISDLKTREIPDWLSYSLLFFVIATRGLQSILLRDQTYVVQTLIFFVIFFIFGNLMYYTRQWGGGDTKLITALGSAFAIRPAYLIETSIIPFAAILLLNILIVGAIYGIIYAIYLSFKHKDSFKKEFKKLNHSHKTVGIKMGVLIIAILLFVSSFTIFPANTRSLTGLLALILLIIPYLITALKSTELACMFKEIPVNKLTEGDWVQKDVYKNRKLICKVNPYGINKKEIELLKKANIKQVLVKEGIPFVPPFLIGTIVTLIVGGALFIPII
ncbi:prepilin peptidase [Candidatus Woesearchaeota archaeon]|jgi:Flp pilus assembly protein protease CpaA|nr:prepilin peptidase [Candidatus Woesearchaeota archaeon]MBT6044565.1 prepilin peptidase [Candidatus Woesearchaeota archaeon]